VSDADRRLLQPRQEHDETNQQQAVAVDDIVPAPTKKSPKPRRKPKNRQRAPAQRDVVEFAAATRKLCRIRSPSTAAVRTEIRLIAFPWQPADNLAKPRLNSAAVQASDNVKNLGWM
jgi:hypothetical protein